MPTTPKFSLAQDICGIISPEKNFRHLITLRPRKSKTISVCSGIRWTLFFSDELLDKILLIHVSDPLTMTATLIKSERWFTLAISVRITTPVYTIVVVILLVLANFSICCFSLANLRTSVWIILRKIVLILYSRGRA